MEMLGLECMIGSSPAVQLFIRATIPVWLAIGFGIAHFVFGAVKEKCMNSLGMLMVGIFAALTGGAFAPFSCYSGPNGKSVLQQFPAVHCDFDDSEYPGCVVVGIITIIAYPICGFAYIINQV